MYTADRTVLRIRALLARVRLLLGEYARNHLHWRLAIIHSLVRRLTCLASFAELECTNMPYSPQHMREPVVVRCCDSHSSSNERITKRRSRNDKADKRSGEVGNGFAEKVRDCSLMGVNVGIQYIKTLMKLTTAAASVVDTTDQGSST